MLQYFLGPYLLTRAVENSLRYLMKRKCTKPMNQLTLSIVGLMPFLPTLNIREFKDILRTSFSLILDASSFENSMLLRKSLDDTLRTIRLKINGYPTVLWTGNGYHVYQPIDAVILEELSQFEQFENPSSKFLRFVERYLTNEKSDPAHNPSFKSCMLRIPGSTNSKCELRNNTVEIIQKWDGYRPPISLLFESFHAYLLDLEV